jgi:hypothetical protein
MNIGPGRGRTRSAVERFPATAGRRVARNRDVLERWMALFA